MASRSWPAGRCASRSREARRGAANALTRTAGQPAVVLQGADSFVVHDLIVPSFVLRFTSNNVVPHRNQGVSGVAGVAAFVTADGVLFDANTFRGQEQPDGELFRENREPASSDAGISCLVEAFGDGLALLAPRDGEALDAEDHAQLIRIVDVALREAALIQLNTAK